ncbi:MAG: dihydroorotase [Nitrospirota bacterium]|nr:dihydroorotase [Nitrospirota bacterium]
MSDLLIHGGTVVLPDGERVADVAVEGGKIHAISAPGQTFSPGAFSRAVDAAGLVVLPGAIDAHVHFRVPGGEHKEDWDTGSMAALAGGVTTVLDMPNTDPPTTTLAALEDKRARIAPRARVNWGLYMGATKDNLAEVKQARNIAGLKIYMGSSTGGLLVYEDGPLASIFGGYSGRICVHAEDEQIIRDNSLKFSGATDVTVHGRIRTVTSAKRATERAIALARRFARPVHICHMSTAEELELVRAARHDGITCEVTPHHLVLNEDGLADLGTLGKMNPPLRGKHDNEALWGGLADGVIDFVATDHAPHTLKEKMGGYWEAPSGVPGVQHMLPLLLNGVHYGRLTLTQVAQVTATGPAERFGIQNKGRIAPGHDADLVLAAMGDARLVRVKDVVSKCGWTPYEGMDLYGWPEVTVLGGQVVYERGRFPKVTRGREVMFG